MTQATKIQGDLRTPQSTKESPQKSSQKPMQTPIMINLEASVQDYFNRRNLPVFRAGRSAIALTVPAGFQ
jgi:hypothetical protein